jgi:hypothetical protein
MALRAKKARHTAGTNRSGFVNRLFIIPEVVIAALRSLAEQKRVSGSTSGLGVSGINRVYADGCRTLQKIFMVEQGTCIPRHLPKICPQAFLRLPLSATSCSKDEVGQCLSNPFKYWPKCVSA